MVPRMMQIPGRAEDGRAAPHALVRVRACAHAWVRACEEHQNIQTPRPQKRPLHNPPSSFEPDAAEAWSTRVADTLIHIGGGGHARANAKSGKPHRQ